MLNLRVDDRNDLRGKLRAADVAATTDPAWVMPGAERLAPLHGPEGDPIESWEPDQAQ